MPGRSRPKHGFGLLIALVVGACGSVTPSPSPPQSAGIAPNSPSISPTATSRSSPSVVPRALGQIVFDDSGEGFVHSQIWIENADGSNARQVVSDAFTDGSATLSPDGKRIVFTRIFTDSIEAAIADPSLFGTLTIANVDGSGLHEILTGERKKLCDIAPEGDAWSPDGTQFVYVRYCFDRSAGPVEAGIWTAKSDGSGPRQVTRTLPESNLQDHRVGWSPDGQSLTFERIDTATTPERAAIFTIGIDGKGLHQVTPWSLAGNDPDWSPDGRLIAFNASAEPSPTQNIYTIRPDGSGLTKLTMYNQDGQATFHPSWSPDGGQILFSHSPSTDGWGDFFVMDRDGGNQHVIAKTALHENHGSWGSSPTP
jgi:Tol biopolymer transport system component